MSGYMFHELDHKTIHKQQKCNHSIHSERHQIAKGLNWKNNSIPSRAAKKTVETQPVEAKPSSHRKWTHRTKKASGGIKSIKRRPSDKKRLALFQSD